MKRTNNNSYCLKVYFHVIRRSNGTGGQSIESVNEAFNILNQDFNPHNISFNWDETIDYIDNTTYYNNPNHGLTANTPPTIFSINNHQDGIDIYLYDDSTGGSGLANGVGNSSEFYVTGSYWKTPFNSLIRSHIISHEMGHVLYLWHTHHGTFNEGGNDNPCPELVNGSNSNTCGDYVGDTPADPHLQFNVNSSTCEWNSFGTDANGDSYDPDEQNVMSYTDINCMEYFTSGQGERMRNAIATLPYLQDVVANSCFVQELSSIDQLCYSNNKTLTISGLENNITTWQTSFNVTILSSSNNSITIRAKYSNSTGNGWVKATLSNGITLRDDFKVGVLSSSSLSLDSFRSTHIFANRWTNITTRYNGIIDIGQLGYKWNWYASSSQMRGNNGHSSYIHVRPLNKSVNRMYIRVNVENECGCSDWKGKWFDVETPSSNCRDCPTNGGEIHY